MRQSDRKRVEKVKDKVYRIARDIEYWTGKRPKVVRVTLSDYLLLVDAGEVDSFFQIEVKPG